MIADIFYNRSIPKKNSIFKHTITDIDKETNGFRRIVNVSTTHHSGVGQRYARRTGEELIRKAYA